ncbi:arginyl-tRNA--protein transferase 1 [Ctenocephalides felis]|uniref:arginyl-tRNA--protein transferase 1 n=1 Tax=Ctenocephalides felis TaxID=7515 RepID=UPI000E6E2F86|nr:arginyl-tRNA--protein transferase 1 [Ctenocephalides felis]XP_026474943.1 arginyl-tRNA--protein transferase 1 [Ctenocephalides felis]
MSNYSVVEYFGKNVSKCGYCKQNEGSKCHGMWTHCLTVQDYQDLIDRGWRRSGKYCYKPIMDESCCKLYTIKCAALNLQLSKSQKKNVKNVNKFLSNGIKDSTVCEDVHSLACGDQMNIDNKPTTLMTNRVDDIEAIGIGSEISMANTTDHVSNSSEANDNNHCLEEKSSIKSVKQGLGADLTRPPCKKAKVLRMERKKAKLLERGVVLEEKLQSKNVDKTLEDLVNNIPDKSVHKLECRLLHIQSSEFLDTVKESFIIYHKYQTVIHKEPSDECDFKSFEDFLCDSPLESLGDFGSFHQQYYLDGKLIAVGVIDILPSCVSSVYFYYDPDYGHMSLGTYGALRELMLVRQLNQKYPDLKYYYMGYYIHTCLKMKYKARLRPSFLLCPVTYTWISIEKCLPKIDASPYSRLSSDGEDLNYCNENDLSKVRVLWGRTIHYYYMYARNNEEADAHEVLEYARLIGKTLSRRMLLYRQ